MAVQLQSAQRPRAQVHASTTGVKVVQLGFEATGATVVTVDNSLPAPTDPLPTDFTPFAQQVKNQKADLVFVAWAGTTAGAMWNALDQQGVFNGPSGSFFDAPSTKLRSIFSSENGIRASSCRLDLPVP